MDARPPLDDLMARLAGGDPAAAAPLFEGCRRPLFAFLFRMTGSADLAEDLLQEAYLAIQTGRGTFSPGRPFLPWAFAVARNAFYEWKRHEAKVIRLRLAPTDPDALHAAPDPGGRAERRADLSAALATLPDAAREAFLLKHFHGFTYDEIADLQQAPASTVKSRVLSSIAKLRLALGEGE